jgi:hypothetical protein
MMSERLFENSEIYVFLRFFALIPAFSQREKEPETAKNLPSSPKRFAGSAWERIEVRETDFSNSL